jgi:hypothetical protein
MSPRTLTDELRSVLLFHALDAPEPNATVDRILSDTVGAVTELGGPDARPAPAPTGRPLRAQQLVAAAVVAVLLVGVAAINSTRNHRSATETAARASRSAADQQLNEATAGRAMVLPGPANGAQAQAGPAEPPAYAGHELDCATIPGGHLVTGQWTEFSLPGGRSGYVYEFFCAAPDGQRSASEVQVFRQSGATLRYHSTLLYPAADQYLSFLVGGGSTLRIQSYVHSRWNGYSAGDVITTNWDLAAADPRAGAGSGIALDASGIAEQREPGDPGCVLADLTATVTAIEDAAAPSWRLALRNGAAQACGLEGFPAVNVQRAGTTLGTVRPTLNGPAGGVRTAPVPPVIVLPPGATAAAIIEQSPASAPDSCPRSDRLQVSLPNGVALAPLPAELPGCGLVVHPLVGNARGTD